jgi:hypothetical protein
VAVAVKRAGEEWETTLTVTHGRPWRYVAAVALHLPRAVRYQRIEVRQAEQVFTWKTAERPVRVDYDAALDVPVPRDDVYSLPTMLDEFDKLLWVQGTGRQVEANRTLSLLWRDAVADASVEVLPPLLTDAEDSDADLSSHDRVLVGGPADNGVAARAEARWALPLTTGPASFRWQGQLHARPEDGLAVAFPNPWNPARAAWLFLANSKVQLWRMLKAWTRGQASFGLWREGEVVQKGWLGAERLEVVVPPEAKPGTAAKVEAAR